MDQRTKRADPVAEIPRPSSLRPSPGGSLTVRPASPFSSRGRPRAAQKNGAVEFIPAFILMWGLEAEVSGMKTDRQAIGRGCVYCESPIGLLEITARRSGIESVSFVEKRKKGHRDKSPDPDVRLMLGKCASQIREYFRGRRKRFELKIAPSGTEFQKRVWRAVLGIPFGRTESYKDVARAVGNVRATRAVGGANHANPVVIIIPCHRVLGSDGRLTGYGGGLWRKEWLLSHERKFRGTGDSFFLRPR